MFVQFQDKQVKNLCFSTTATLQFDCTLRYNLLVNKCQFQIKIGPLHILFAIWLRATVFGAIQKARDTFFPSNPLLMTEF